MTQQTKNFTSFLKTNLNKEQKKAVTATDGVFLVVAGAGSGKTRVITARIANLIINHDAAPETIVALTFTNKAANEMKKRVHQFLPPDTPLPFVGTFHSYCLRVLKKYNHLLEKPFVSIFDEDDKTKLLSDIVKRFGLGKQTTAKKISYLISQIKNSMTDGNPETSTTYQFAMPFAKEVFAAYEREKTASKCFDFDDLLLEALNLFRTNNEFKKEFQESVCHLLVDEYQDTNTVQHELLKQMSQNEKKITADSVCVVGDEDQSIYSWRGATVANIVNFKKDFPKTKTFTIEQNYRSVQPILDVANHVIKNNVNRNPKKLWTDKTARDRIRVVTSMSEYQEGDIVAQFLKTAQEKQKLSSIAVLYRAHYQSRAIEEALIRNAIPYKIIGGIQFYERKEIKDILAYLRLIVNPFDRTSFFRVINCPTRGLGQKFEDLFYEHWNQESFFNFKDVANYLIGQNDLLTNVKRQSLQTFINIFQAVDTTTAPSDALEQIIVRTEYLTHLKNTYDEKEAQARNDNVKELLRAVKYLEEQGTTTIIKFLDDVALMQEKATEQNEEEKDAALLMTLHAVKGLEFHTVIIVGVEDGVLPGSRSFIDSDALEEERRLFYVGITRAQERLLLTHSKYRYTYGQMTTQPPSRFLAELPTTRFAHHDCSHSRAHDIDVIVANWLGITTRAFKNPEVFTFGPATRTQKKSQASSMLRPAGAPKKQKITASTGWKKNQPVQHKTFGIGVIQKVEKRTASKIYLTVKFKTGVKKLDAQFIKRV